LLVGFWGGGGSLGAVIIGCVVYGIQLGWGCVVSGFDIFWVHFRVLFSILLTHSMVQSTS